MKKYLLLTLALLGMAVSADAMSYEQARQQALFLTDKMAYELNLTEEQYEAAYEVNFDYLLGVNDPSELYGTYWEQRNLDLGYILLDWQYNAYLAASYFYRPLYWNAGYWHFGIYARYPHRDYFYFGRPRFFDTYRGGHCWHNNGGHSWYHGRDFVPNRGGQKPDKDHHTGMRDGFRRGDFGNGQRHFGTNTDNNRQQTGGRENNMNSGSRDSGSRQGNGSSTFGTRRSSTRSTVGTHQTVRQDRARSIGSKAETSVGRSATTSPTQTIKQSSSRQGVRSVSPSSGRSINSVKAAPSARTHSNMGSPSSVRSHQSASPSMSRARSASGASAGSRAGGGASHGGRR